MTSELWQRLKAARDYADKRQEDIARACGVSRGAVALWERAIPEKRTRPDVKQIQVVARETGLPVEWLLNDAADPADVWRIGALTRAPVAVQVSGDRALEAYRKAVEYEVMRRAPLLLSCFDVTIGPVRVDFAHGRVLVVFALAGEDMDKMGRLLLAEKAGGRSFDKHLLVWQREGIGTLPAEVFDVASALVDTPAAAAEYLLRLAQK